MEKYRVKESKLLIVPSKATKLIERDYVFLLDDARDGGATRGLRVLEPNGKPARDHPDKKDVVRIAFVDERQFQLTCKGAAASSVFRYIPASKSSVFASLSSSSSSSSFASSSTIAHPPATVSSGGLITYFIYSESTNVIHKIVSRLREWNPELELDDSKLRRPFDEMRLSDDEEDDDEEEEEEEDDKRGATFAKYKEDDVPAPETMGGGTAGTGGARLPLRPGTRIETDAEDADDNKSLDGTTGKRTTALLIRPPPRLASFVRFTPLDMESFLRVDTSSWTRYFCRIRNRYQVLEPTTLLFSPDGEEIHFRPCVLSSSLQTTAAAQQPPPQQQQQYHSSHGTDLSETGSGSATTPGGGSMSESNEDTPRGIHLLIKVSQIMRISLHGTSGTAATFHLSSAPNSTIEIHFETCGSRDDSVSRLVMQTNMMEGRVVLSSAHVSHAGEECALADINGFSTSFAAHALKIMGSVRSARVYTLDAREGTVFIFRGGDLNEEGILEEAGEPSKSVNLRKAGGVFVDLPPASRTANARRLKWAMMNESGSLPLTKDYHELAFPCNADRERFASYLHAMNANVRFFASFPSASSPGSADDSSSSSFAFLPAAFQRRAWMRPDMSWFEARKRLYVGTFNVGDGPPPSSSLLDLWVISPAKHRRKTNIGAILHGAGVGSAGRRLRAKSGSAGAMGRYDLYVFGLQECRSRFEEWQKALASHLGGGYHAVCSLKMGEMGLLVFASASECKFVTGVETSTVATGMGLAKEITGKQLGNKGAVACGLRWHDTSLCFISAHLAPHQDAVDKRNRDFSQIVNKLNLAGDAGGVGEITHAFDHVFFFGDLNYRVDGEFKKVVHVASQGDWPALLELDQLTKEVKAGRSFAGFREADVPAFPPTYRWERERRQFSNKRDQPPSYTDRVMMSSRRGKEDRLKTTHYGSAQDMLGSDHRPVAATFALRVRLPYMPWPYHPLAAALEGGKGGNDSKKGEEDPDEGEEGDAEAALWLNTEGGGVTAGTNHGDNKVAQEEEDDTVVATHGDQPEPSAAGSTTIPNPPFLGSEGSFFITPEMVETGLAPKLLLCDVLVRLAPLNLHRSATPSPNSLVLPPAFLVMRVGSRAAHEVSVTEARAGSEIHPDDVVEGDKAEFAYQYEAGREWGELFYSWRTRKGKLDDDDEKGTKEGDRVEGGEGMEDENEEEEDLAVSLDPLVWDPCYLSTQSLTIAMHQPERSGIKERVQNLLGGTASAFSSVSADDDEGPSGSVSSSPLAPVHKSSAGTVGSMGSSASSTNNRASLRRNNNNNNNVNNSPASASSLGSGMIDAPEAAAQQFSSTSFGPVAGQATITLKPLIERARRTVLREGFAAFIPSSSSRASSDLSVEFSEPIMSRGVEVGVITGRLRLMPPSDGALRRAFETRRVRPTMISRCAPKNAEPSLAKSGGVDVQIEGIGDKRGLNWRRAWVALGTEGTLYVCPSRPGGAGGGSAARAKFAGVAWTVVDLGEGSMDKAPFLPSAADRTMLVEVTGKFVGGEAQRVVGGKTSVVMGFESESERDEWASCFLAVQAGRKGQRDLAARLVREAEKRRKQHAIQAAATSPPISPVSPTRRAESSGDGKDSSSGGGRKKSLSAMIFSPLVSASRKASSGSVATNEKKSRNDSSDGTDVSPGSRPSQSRKHSTRANSHVATSRPDTVAPLKDASSPSSPTSPGDSLTKDRTSSEVNVSSVASSTNPLFSGPIDGEEEITMSAASGAAGTATSMMSKKKSSAATTLSEGSDTGSTSPDWANKRRSGSKRAIRLGTDEVVSASTVEGRGGEEGTSGENAPPDGGEKKEETDGGAATTITTRKKGMSISSLLRSRAKNDALKPRATAAGSATSYEGMGGR